MQINLYVLVDKSGRIIYTSDYVLHLEEFKRALNQPDLQIILLKGDLNESIHTN